MEWLDPHSGLTRRYQFLYWPATRDVEMFDLKNRRAFLKKTPIPTLAMEDLFLGAVVAVYARQLKVVEFGDAFTEQRFATTRQRGKENGSRLDSRADPDPFWFASRGFGLRDRFASSPIMSPRYVR